MIRRQTTGKLEHLARNLKVRKPRIATGTAVGAAMGMGVALVAPFTFGTSLAVTVAVAGIGVPLGAGKSNLRLTEVQAAINSYCRACAELQGQLDSLTENLHFYFFSRRHPRRHGQKRGWYLRTRITFC